MLTLKDTMGKVLTSLQSVRDPELFAEKMYKYATSEDPKWKSLLARIEAGDTSSHLETQQFLLNEEIGDRKSQGQKYACVPVHPVSDVHMKIQLSVSCIFALVPFRIQCFLKSFHTHVQSMQVIDLEAMGFGGDKLPDILRKSIERVKSDEPLLWDSILTDPIAKSVVENPIEAVKEIVAAAMDASAFAKASA